MSPELIALSAFSLGIPMFIIGWIWSIVVAKQINTGWMLGNILLLPILVFTLVHWHKARKPFYLTSAGLVLIIVTLLLIPDS